MTAWRRFTEDGTPPCSSPPSGEVTSAHAAVEMVIQTATALLLRRLSPREAVTILATQGPQARAVAPSLVRSEPDRAAGYADLVTSLARELYGGLEGSDDPSDLRAVLEDLDRLAQALRG